MTSDVGNAQVTDAPKTGGKRPPGRPKGYAKTGGRQKPPTTPEQALEYIATRSRTWERLSAIASGNRISVPDPDDPTKAIRVIPPLSAQLAALRILADRQLPTLRAVDAEVRSTGVNVTADISDVERARWVGHWLNEGLARVRDAEPAEPLAIEALDVTPPAPPRASGPIATRTTAEPAPAPAQPTLPSVGHTEALRVSSGVYSLTLEQRMQDGRERWAARTSDGRLVASMFGRAALVEALQPAPAPWEAADRQRAAQVPAVVGGRAGRARR